MNDTMHIGVMMHFTDHTATPADVAVAAEERGFESMFATEHTHIPVRDFITWWGGQAMPEEYKRLHDPLITRDSRRSYKQDQARHRHPRTRPTRTARYGQTTGVTRSPQWRQADLRCRVRVASRRTRRPRSRLGRPQTRAPRTHPGRPGALG